MEGKGSITRRSSDVSFSFPQTTKSLFMKGRGKPSHIREKPILKFRRVAKLTVLCVRLCKQSYESVEAAKNEFLSVVQVSKDMEASITKDGLFFDPSDFKTNKERRLGQEARRILQLKPELRSEKDFEFLQIALRRIRAFAEYPKRMQRKLVQVGWYEGYEPKRAIVRQGHVPQSFYFILSGTVVVTAYDKDAHASRTLVFLYQGMSFGELAVITRSVRQATVSSTTDTELLCISSQDFENVFMSGGTKNVNDPDHNSFMEGIQFLKHIPVKNMLQNTSACLFHYFDRGQVMVRDSNKSDWIYVVKSGSLSVLKKLLQVVPELNSKECETEKEMEAAAKLPYLNEHSKHRPYECYGQKAYYERRLRLHNRYVKRLRKTSETQTYKNIPEMERHLALKLPGVFNMGDRLGVVDYDDVIKTHKSRVFPKTSTVVKLPQILNENAQSGLSTPVPFPDEPKVKRTNKGVYFSRPTSGARRKKPKERQKREEKDLQRLAERRIAQVKEQQKNLTGRKTIADEFDNKPIPDAEPTLTDIHPMFIVVQILERGQYFGISQLIYTEQPSFSVVSNGSECIMISKKFFIENSKPYARHHLRLKECPYPTDDDLQTNLQSYVNWEAYRSDVYTWLVHKTKQQEIKKKQFLPRSFGNYCFRTGLS